MATNRSSDLLSLLVAAGDLSEEQADQVFANAEERNVQPVEALLSGDFGLDERALIRRLCEIVNYKYIDLLSTEIDPAVIPLLNQQQCELFTVLPVRMEEGRLVVAVPFESAKNTQLKDDIRRITREKVQFIDFQVAVKVDIVEMISRVFRVDKELDKIGKANRQPARRPTPTPSAVSTAAGLPEEVGEDSKVTRFVDLVITQALADRASDIHFDAREDGVQVRYRVDGIMSNVASAPNAMKKNIASRIKYLANLDISESRKPQDGRINLETGNRKVDLRIATLPGTHGEKIVMRVLDNAIAMRPLEDIGFSADNLRRLREMLARENGMVLVTGPTGSGKSTTLYAALNELSDATKNVITVEDPVEFQIAEITQIPVNAKAELTFASILRTVLRADPDIILVGEIRDNETAVIATQAALTGHLVLSTLHTNDAASALTRLTEMDIQPFLVGATLRGVVAQRLVRRLCERCKESHEANLSEQKQLGLTVQADESAPQIFRAVGCSACSDRGYFGRLALHEVLTVTEEMEIAIAHDNARSLDIEHIAVRDGMATIREDGWAKVLAGETTIEEVLRVVS